MPKNKSRHTPQPCFRQTLPTTLRPVRIATVRDRGDAMIVAADLFESSPTRPSTSSHPGSYARSATPAAELSPTTHPFALPHKRYVRDAVLERAADYLADEQRSYRQAARNGRQSIGYLSPAPAAAETRTPDPDSHATALMPHTACAAIDERHFSHTTIWRWLGWLGALRQTLRTALQLILQKDPRSTLHRQVCAVAAPKYRTPARRTRLQQAVRLLLAAAAFRRLFARELFPYFATADGDG